MEFSEIESYVQQILTLEFADRDQEIDTNVLRVKSDMAARGISISTITLNQMAEFFLGEFRARVNLIADHAIRRIGTLTEQPGSDATAQVVSLYKQLASQQFAHIERAYEAGASTIQASLLSSMPEQIREVLSKRMSDYMKKNELTVEYESKACRGSESQKDVLLLRPSFCGMGIDLKELWNRYMK